MGAWTASSRPATAQGKEAEILGAMREERDKWQALYEAEAEKVAFAFVLFLSLSRSRREAVLGVRIRV
jgi:hypothetical protein